MKLWNYEESETPVASPKVSKRYVAVRGLSFDYFNARLWPGEEVPREYLEDIRTDVEGLLQKGAIKELRED